MTTATGGRMRCAIIQKAMSSLARVRTMRRPHTHRSRAKSPAADATARGQATPRATAATAATTHPDARRILPTRGR
jgi:hypothetical protein